MRLTLRQLLTRGKLIVLIGLAALPPLLALLYNLSSSRTDPETFLVGLYQNVVYTIVAPVIALVFAAATLGSEMEDGTIVYLLMKPIPRWQIVASKLVVTVAVIVVFVVASIGGTALTVGQGFGETHAAFAFAAGAALGGAAYAAIFCFLGLITSRALIAGLLYVFIWEGLITRLFTGARNFSVREYMKGIADLLSTIPNNIFQAQLSGGRALLGSVVVIVLFSALAVRRLWTMNIT